MSRLFRPDEPNQVVRKDFLERKYYDIEAVERRLANKASTNLPTTFTSNPRISSTDPSLVIDTTGADNKGDIIFADDGTAKYKIEHDTSGSGTLFIGIPSGDGLSISTSGVVSCNDLFSSSRTTSVDAFQCTTGGNITLSGGSSTVTAVQLTDGTATMTGGAVTAESMTVSNSGSSSILTIGAEDDSSQGAYLDIKGNQGLYDAHIRFYGDSNNLWTLETDTSSEWLGILSGSANTTQANFPVLLIEPDFVTNTPMWRTGGLTFQNIASGGDGNNVLTFNGTDGSAEYVISHTDDGSFDIETNGGEGISLATTGDVTLSQDLTVTGLATVGGLATVDTVQVTDQGADGETVDVGDAASGRVRVTMPGSGTTETFTVQTTAVTSADDLVFLQFMDNNLAQRAMSLNVSSVSTGSFTLELINNDTSGSVAVDVAFLVVQQGTPTVISDAGSWA